MVPYKDQLYKQGSKLSAGILFLETFLNKVCPLISLIFQNSCFFFPGSFSWTNDVWWKLLPHLLLYNAMQSNKCELKIYFPILIDQFQNFEGCIFKYVNSVYITEPIPITTYINSVNTDQGIKEISSTHISITFSIAIQTVNLDMVCGRKILTFYCCQR